MSAFEDAVGDLNSGVFWPEFTFVQTQFVPYPGLTGELADNLIWYDDRAFVVQMKEREVPTSDLKSERTWFRKKVLGEATRQIRESLAYLKNHEEIQVTNQRNDKWYIAGAKITDITRIVLCAAAKNLPPDCKNVRHHKSGSVGYIHIIQMEDYLTILQYFDAPEDLRLYLKYREKVVPKIHNSGGELTEADIIGAYILEQDLPSSNSRDVLSRIPIEFPLLEFQRILSNLRAHIHDAPDRYSYYKVLQQFAKVPRSVWREVNARFERALHAAGVGRFIEPTRVIDPNNDLTFMVATFDPALPRDGAVGKEIRTRGLENLTFTAMYMAKTSKCVGMLVSADAEHFSIDWSSFDEPWMFDADMEEMLADGSPFRDVHGAIRRSFVVVPEKP